jgi:hypothetical protein
MVAGTVEGAKLGKGTKAGEELFSRMFEFINRVLPGARKESDYRRDLHFGTRECYIDVAVKNNKVVGVCVYDVVPLKEKKVTLFRLIAIDEKCGNRGVGTALFNDMLIKSKGNGSSYIISTIKEEHLSDPAKLAFFEDTALLRTVKLPDCTPLVCAIPVRVDAPGTRKKQGMATMHFYIRHLPQYDATINTRELGELLVWYYQQRVCFINGVKKKDLDASLGLALAQLDKPLTFFADSFVELIRANKIPEALDKLPVLQLPLLKLSDY